MFFFCCRVAVKRETSFTTTEVGWIGNGNPAPTAWGILSDALVHRLTPIIWIIAAEVLGGGFESLNSCRKVLLGGVSVSRH